MTLRRTLGQWNRRALSRLSRAEHTRTDDALTLTFDDGPHAAHTPEVLDALAAHGINATFFLIGQNACRHPELVHRIRSGGHSIGSHSMNHFDLRRISPRRALAELHDGRSAIEDIVGEPVPLFRPPMGHLTYVVAAAVRSSRWRTVLWNTDTHDWKSTSTAESVAAEAASAPAGGILLMHDSVPHTAAAVENIAALMADRTFVAL